MSAATATHGGHIVADVLAAHGVPFLFTLCGGHISPILIAGKARGLRVIDVRHEATAVFAADAVARLSGVPGVAVVTAGPGLTNTITAVKNAQLAQSPVLVIGGATATLLKGRGSLQDIDQQALMRPHVKWQGRATQVRQIRPLLQRALVEAQSGVPGPVFLELPINLLYPERVVREWTAGAIGRARSLSGRLRNWYIRRHTDRLFAAAAGATAAPAVTAPAHTRLQLSRIAAALAEADRPLMLVGSQALLNPAESGALQQAVQALGIPTYLSGMGRGLLGRHPLHMRHKRRQALKEADVVILAGVPADFRLNYGRSIPRSATLIAVNRSPVDIKINRAPDIGVLADPGTVLRELPTVVGAPPPPWAAWHGRLQARDAARDAEIAALAADETDFVNPMALLRALEGAADEDSVFIGDGGDFVATASYILRPRAPLTWLDPGVFGTLGSGAGFALGAALCRPGAEVWLLYGDGSAAYSLAEFDTFARHGLPVIAVVGTDGSWAQIARDQVAIFGDDVGTTLNRAPYHQVAQGYGGEGLLLTEGPDIGSRLAQAKALAAKGRPVLVNAFIGQTDFRQGSISV